MRKIFDRLPGGGPWRQLVFVSFAVLAVAVIGAGGSVLKTESATFDPGRILLVGRTKTVCTVTPTTDDRRTDIAAVAIRLAPGREGKLTGNPIGKTDQTLDLSEQGIGTKLVKQRESVLLSGEGVMATASAGAVLTSAISGDDRGISYAPCTAPAVDQWFVGIGSTRDFRSELILTNADASQAEVDLRFFGPKGVVVVPGSPGIIIPAQSSRSISLESLVDSNGPLTVNVRATRGRVSAMARDLRSSDLGPAGADWHPSSVSPAHQVLIPGIPEGDGSRELVVTNPGVARAEVTVEIIGSQGSFSPVGAEQIELNPESTASVELVEALAGEAVGVRLSSTQPITGSVSSRSERQDAATDLAVEVASPHITRTGVAALAGLNGTDNQLVLSNAGDAEVTVSLELVGYDGTTRREDNIPMAAGSTDTRMLASTGDAYLVVKAPDGSRVYAGMTYAASGGNIAGLTSAALVSPDLASRAPELSEDPSVGR